MTEMHFITSLRMTSRVNGARGGKAGVHHFVEGDGARLASDSGQQIDVMRAVVLKLAEVFLVGLDVDAAPTAFIKGFGHRIDYRMLRADVDIKPLFHFPQSAVKHYVFVVLGVGNKAHDDPSNSLRMQTDRPIARAAAPIPGFPGCLRPPLAWLRELSSAAAK